MRPQTTIPDFDRRARPARLLCQVIKIVVAFFGGSTMSLNIKNPEVEELLDRIVQITGETKTEAVRVALAERYQRILEQSFFPRRKRLRYFLENEVWPTIPEDVLEKPFSKEMQEQILGFGKFGV